MRNAEGIPVQIQLRHTWKVVRSARGIQTTSPGQCFNIDQGTLKNPIKIHLRKQVSYHSLWNLLFSDPFATRTVPYTLTKVRRENPMLETWTVRGVIDCSTDYAHADWQSLLLTKTSIKWNFTAFLSCIKLYKKKLRTFIHLLSVVLVVSWPFQKSVNFSLFFLCYSVGSSLPKRSTTSLLSKTGPNSQNSNSQVRNWDWISVEWRRKYGMFLHKIVNCDAIQRYGNTQWKQYLIRSSILVYWKKTRSDAWFAFCKFQFLLSYRSSAGNSPTGSWTALLNPHWRWQWPLLPW